MIVTSIIYLAVIICAVLITGSIIKAKKRNILVAIPVTVIGIPTILVGLLFAFKGPIQQGKLLKNTTIGPFLNLISPPSDLYFPLASIKMEPEKTEYILSFSHKYLGNHALTATSPKPVKEANPIYSDISITLSISDGAIKLLSMEPNKANQFFGRTDYGAFLARYKVPKDLPVSKPLTATVIISGNLSGFLERRGATFLTIKKFSDQ